jgi:DNA-directed RNA polymerase specialized sigma24 family protein
MTSNITPSPSSEPQPLSVQELQKAFSAEVSILLLPNHPPGTAFLNFIRFYLFVWHLSDIDPRDILAEAVYQGLKSIQINQQPIEIPKAWLRVTCINLMRKQVRVSVQHNQISTTLKEQSHETESPLTIVERLEWLDKLDEAIKHLAPNEQELVQLRLIEDKTYEQIRYWLTVRDGQAPEIPALRKRYSRALNSLKHVFSTVYQD